MWAVGRLIWVRGPGYCQLIWAEIWDVCRLSARCLQVATLTGGLKVTGDDSDAEIDCAITGGEFLKPVAVLVF
jgi:hypothetical protein